MSAVLDTSATDRPIDERVEVASPTLPRVVRSEWIKFRTLRSTVAVLGAAVLGLLVIGMIIAYNTRHLGPSLDANDIVASSPLQGYYLGQLLIGALGVLFVTGEFGTGMIASTFSAVPRRLPVLWAKLIVFVVVTLVVMTVTSLVTFLASQGLISHYRTAFSLTDPGALRVVLATGLYLTLVGVIGAMIGWIVRSTPGALVAFFALLLVLPIVFGNLFGTWGGHVAEFLPDAAGGAFASSLPEAPHLSAWAGLVVLLGWVAVLMAAAIVTLRRRDT